MAILQSFLTEPAGVLCLHLVSRQMTVAYNVMLPFSLTIDLITLVAHIFRTIPIIYSLHVTMKCSGRQESKSDRKLVGNGLVSVVLNAFVLIVLMVNQGLQISQKQLVGEREQVILLLLLCLPSLLDPVIFTVSTNSYVSFVSQICRNTNQPPGTMLGGEATHLKSDKEEDTKCQ